MGAKISNIITKPEELYKFPPKDKLIKCYQTKLHNENQTYLGEKTITKSKQITGIADDEKNIHGINISSELAVYDFNEYMCKDSEKDPRIMSQCVASRMMSEIHAKVIEQALISCAQKSINK